MSVKLDQLQVRTLSIISGVGPSTDNTIDLGSSSLKWKNIYGTLKGNADSATYLKPHNAAIVYTASTWGNIGSNVWGMCFKDPSLGTDTGDITLSLTRYSDSQVVLNAKLDGQVHAGAVRSDGIGFVGNLQGNATTASGILDSQNNTTITVTYAKAGQAATSWLASWNGYELGAISPANITAGKATALTSAGTITMITGTAKHPSGFTVGDIYSSGYPFSYGSTWRYQGTFGAELIFNGLGGDAGVGTGHMYFRTRSDWATSTWGDWKHLLDSSNYTTYTVTKTGGGASGTWGIDISGNAGSATYLKSDNSFVLTRNSLQYFNVSGTAGNAFKANDTPTAGWWHIMRCTHANSTGYYTDLAIPFNDVSLYYKRIANGVVQNNGWVKVLDARNYSSYALPLSGGTMTGQIKLASTGLATYNENGYYINQYGNFVHTGTGTTDNWNINNNAQTIMLKYYWETGVLELANTLKFTNALTKVNSPTVVATFVGNNSANGIGYSNTSEMLVGSATTLYHSNAGSLTWSGDYMLSSATRPNAKLHFGTETLYQHRGAAYHVLLDSGNYTSYAAPASHSHSYLPLGGGTMTGAINFNSMGTNSISNGPSDTSPTVGGALANLVISSWYGISFTTSCAVGYQNKTAIGFDCRTGTIRAAAVYGAVWNDYAEYRSAETVEPGRVVQESSTGIMKLTLERLQPGCEIISDTFGFAIGKTDDCQTPVATSGRVLAYTLEDRDSFELGQAVCSGPNGTVSKMTREEIMMYPERIIGTVSEIPQYDTWGTGNVNVNGRIWIRIR